MPPERKSKLKRQRSFLHDQQWDRGAETGSKIACCLEVSDTKPEEDLTNISDTDIEKKMFGQRVARKKTAFESLNHDSSLVTDKTPTLRRNVSIYKKLRKQYLDYDNMDNVNPKEIAIGINNKYYGDNSDQATSDNDLATSMHQDAKVNQLF